MARYGQAMKDRVVARLLPPESVAIETLSQEVGISVTTLERWRGEALTRPARERAWSAAARLEAVVATAALDEAGQSAWCREHGVYPSELERWRQGATEALADPGEARASQGRDASRQKAHQGTGTGTAAQGQGAGRNRRATGALKKALGDLPGGRGRMIRLEDRRTIVAHIDSARQAGARLAKACEIVGIDARTCQRWKAGAGLQDGDGRPLAERPVPAHALTDTERAEIVSVANEPRFAALPPARIVPALADEGRYIASESSFYRVLREHDQVHHRGRAQAPTPPPSRPRRRSRPARVRSGAGI
jgi:putative transposase